MNRKTTKKLAAYSALAAGVVAIGSSANAQIIYTDVNPDETWTADHQLDLDLNSDGINDFSFLIGAGPTRYALRIAPAVGNEMLGSVSGNFFYPFAMNLNDPINDGVPTWNGTLNGGYMTMAWVYTAGGSYGNWLNATDKYIGLRFFVGANLHYGWARFDVAATNASITVTFKDYAFNSVAEQGLLAGQTTIGLDEATALKTKAFTSGDMLKVTFDQAANGQVNLINMLGQTVKTTEITGLNMDIPLNGLEAGIYMLTVTTEKGNHSQKIYVK
ncbi:MAG: T9SS type A sorting domain-containing protein [Bacteroidales bacterium]